MAANTARHLPASLGPGAPLPGTPYRIVRMLGTGAMGEVYEAEHELLGTRRALKVLAPQHADRADLAERMRVEARALAKLRHKNLVEVLDLGVSADGRPFFAMEVLEGHTLRQTLRANGVLRVALAIEVAIEILEGLGAAHASGLVHRDVKPENVFVCATGAVKVLDFGIAKFSDLAGAPVTQTGFTIGTPRYMAPEQIEGKMVDARSDVYATAIVLYEMTTGAVPFEDAETMALAFAHVTRPPPPPSSRSTQEISPRLEAAILRALSKKPDDRFASAAELAAELRRCTGSSVTTTAIELKAAIAKVEPIELGEARVDVTVATSGEKRRIVASGVRARDDETPGSTPAGQRTALIAGLFVLSLSLAALAAAVVWLARSQHAETASPAAAIATSAPPAPVTTSATGAAGSPASSALAPGVQGGSTKSASDVATGSPSAGAIEPKIEPDAASAKRGHASSAASGQGHASHAPAGSTASAAAPAAAAEKPAAEKPALPGPGF